MKTARCTGWAAALALLLGGCASNDEALAEKDRRMTEVQQENELLRRQIDDQSGTQMVTEQEAKKWRDEAGRLRSQLDQELSKRQALERDLQELRTRAPSASGPDIATSDGIEVETRPNGDVVLRLLDRVTFTPGSAELTQQGQKLVGEVGEIVKKHKDFAVSIEGHTDDQPLKVTADRWRTNMNLSIARAQAVRNYLSQMGKVPETRMRVVGYGESKPIVKAATNEARARNRRVEIILYRDPGA